MNHCNICGAGPEAEYYKGVASRCKPCHKIKALENRWANIEYYREYDRNRGNRQDAEYVQKYRARFPRKSWAHNRVYLAVQRGELTPALKCEQCRDDHYALHAHHDDYAKPLDVRWLCPACHAQWHRDNGEGRNAR